LASVSPFCYQSLSHSPCRHLAIQEGHLYREGWRKVSPRKGIAESLQDRSPPGNEDLLIQARLSPSSDDGDNNFSRTPPEIRNEIMTNQATL
jgi:hypothetical protein